MIYEWCAWMVTNLRWDGVGGGWDVFVLVWFSSRKNVLDTARKQKGFPVIPAALRSEFQWCVAKDGAKPRCKAKVQSRGANPGHVFRDLVSNIPRLEHKAFFK